MIWLTWRQFRAQAWVALAALAAVAITFAITGPYLAHLYNTSGIATCQASGDCGSAAGNFMALVKTDIPYEIGYFLSLGIMYLAPVLIGMFWGAPLVTRELEARTTGSCGTSRSPAPGGWQSSSASSAWPAWPPPGCSASW